MDFPNVFKTKIAAKGKNALNLSCNHLTTMDFGSFLPVYYRHLNPGEKLSVDASCFSRLNPLAYPTLGDVKIETRAFWVPYHIISESWQDFISNMQVYYDEDGTAQTPAVPTFRNSSVVRFFFSDAFEDGLNRFGKLVSSSSSYDVILRAMQNEGDTSSYATFYLQLTSEGNFVVNMLQSLGYEINWSEGDRTVFNAFGFLAFIRIFVDWYVNPNYDWSDIKRWFRGNDREIDSAGFAEILYYMPYVNYRPDYFTAAQKTTLVNNTVQNSNFTVSQGVSNVNSGSLDTSIEPIVSTNSRVNMPDSTHISHLTNYGIELIQRLADFLKRNNLAGSRYVDQMLVRFGSRPSDEVALQSSYLGSLITNVQMSDVMQTAPDVDASFAAQGVGQYTGKGIAFENGHWSLESNEHGVFMVVSTIRPRTQYYQGRDRHNLHLNPLDFFTPEFDGVNLQAIRQDELITLNGADYTSAISPSGGVTPYSSDSVFGFTPRYAEYKISKDWLTGDFRRARLANTMRCFHLFRELPKEAAHQKAGYNFEVITNSDRLNYDRIFQSPGTTENPYDHFICNFVFDVKYITSVKPIGESLMPEEGGKDVDVRPFGMYF